MDAVIQEFARSPVATVGALAGILSLIFGISLSRQTVTKNSPEVAAPPANPKNASIPIILGKGLMVLSSIFGFGLLASIFIQTHVAIMIVLVPVVIAASVVLTAYLAGNFLSPLVRLLYHEVTLEKGSPVGYVSNTPWKTFHSYVATTLVVVHWVVIVFCCYAAFSGLMELTGASWDDDSDALFTRTDGMVFGFYWALAALAGFCALLQPLAKFVIRHQITLSMAGEMAKQK